MNILISSSALTPIEICCKAPAPAHNSGTQVDTGLHAVSHHFTGSQRQAAFHECIQLCPSANRSLLQGFLFQKKALEHRQAQACTQCRTTSQGLRGKRLSLDVSSSAPAPIVICCDAFRSNKTTREHKLALALAQAATLVLLLLRWPVAILIVCCCRQRL